MKPPPEGCCTTDGKSTNHAVRSICPTEKGRIWAISPIICQNEVIYMIYRNPKNVSVHYLPDKAGLLSVALLFDRVLVQCQISICAGMPGTRTELLF